MKKAYVQFSKRMVTLSIISADVFTAAALYLLHDMEDADGIVRLMQYFLLFTGMVFVAYCGNSAIEKWALAKLEQTKFEVKTTTTAELG